MSKITKSAKGEDCQVRIPGVCNFDPSTTIPAHRNGGGVAMKVHDIFTAYCCSACHDVVDGRVKTEYTHEEILIWFYEGIFRTQEKVIKKGLIKVEGEKNVRNPRKW